MIQGVSSTWVQTRTLKLAITALVLLFLWRRVPLARLGGVLVDADIPLFLAAMIPNAVFFFCWDTLVLTVAVRWFHGEVKYRDLLPVRATSYVVALFNSHAARATVAAYLSRTLGSPFLQLGSTVLFLVLTEYLHLVGWATVGILYLGPQRAGRLLWVPPAIALVWLVVLAYTRLGSESQRSSPVSWILAPRRWTLLRTFRLAPAQRYLAVVALRAPAFFVSLCLHYLAAPAFGLDLPFVALLAFLPVIFMIAALPITVAHLGTTQAAWILLFGSYATEANLLAFSLAAHLSFVVSRALLGALFLPRAYGDLVDGIPRRTAGRRRLTA